MMDWIGEVALLMLVEPNLGLTSARRGDRRPPGLTSSYAGPSMRAAGHGAMGGRRDRTGQRTRFEDGLPSRARQYL